MERHSCSAYGDDMRLTRKTKTLTTVAAVLASVAMAPAAQASTESVGYSEIAHGAYTVQNGVISGELPPGTTQATVPTDPSDPTEALLVRSARPSGLKTANAPTDPSGGVSARASYHDGCVTLFVDGVPGTGLAYHGQMAGCARGELYLHTYVRQGAAGPIIDNGPSNTCANSTSCSVTTDYYTGNEPVITFAAHGRNRTTGGDSTAWATYGNVG